MKTSIIKFAICALIATVAFTSCKPKKKNATTPTTKDKLLGSWQQHQLIDDANNNGTNDDAAVNVDASRFIVTFKSDGTGISSQYDTTVGTFTWSLVGNYIAVADPGTPSTNGILIVSGPSSTMTVQDTSSHPTRWAVYNKK